MKYPGNIKKNNFLIFGVRVFYLLLIFSLILFFLYVPAITWFGSAEKSINVFAWGNTFDPEYFRDFEKETGIKIHFSHYETNEELIVKLEAMEGGGYDLIVPSDYAVKQLINKNLLQPLDRKKIAPFIDKINPAFLGHYFDPKNTYCLPMEWGVFGIGVDKEAFAGDEIPKSWDLIFDKKLLEKYQPIVMVDDPKEAVLFAGLYLFGQTENLRSEQLEKIKQLLIAQKKYVQMYTEVRADYLLSTKNAAVGATTSAYVWQAMRKFDNVDFFVPQEGSFITVEHIAIPRKSTKSDLVYQFLSYVFTKEFAQHSFTDRAIFPCMTDALLDLDLEPSVRDLLTIDVEKMKKLRFLRTNLSRRQITDAWIAVKAS